MRKAITWTKADGIVESDGHLQLGNVDPDNIWTKVWVDTLQTLGFRTCDPHSGNVSGSLKQPESIDVVKKQRSYAGNTYLERTRSRPNLTAISSAAITKDSLGQDRS